MNHRSFFTALCLLVLLAILNAARPCTAEVVAELKSIGKLQLEAPARDVRLTPDGHIAYVLVQNHVLIYSVEDDRIIDRIPVGEEVDRIWTDLRGSVLFLGSNTSPEISVVSVDFSVKIARDRSVSLGDPDAPVTLVLFMDFQCPYCAKVFEQSISLLDRYPKKLNILFKQFPLKSHPAASQAAKASVAADQLGKFIEMAQILYDHQRDLDSNAIEEAARQLGVDMEVFNKKWHSASVEAVVVQDVQTARDLDVKGTPTVYLNGRLINNRYLKDLQRLVTGEIKKASGEAS